VEIIKRTDTGFVVQPKRGVIERTFAWACINRRLARDVERAATTDRALFQIAMIKLMSAASHAPGASESDSYAPRGDSNTSCPTKRVSADQDARLCRLFSPALSCCRARALLRQGSVADCVPTKR
jgi:hypothetical protein